MLIGNSVGSLACVIAASGMFGCKKNQLLLKSVFLSSRVLHLCLFYFPLLVSGQNLVQGLVLLNCAGGMNNKAIVDDWRIKLLLPLLWFFDFLLKQRGIALAIFEHVKQRYY